MAHNFRYDIHPSYGFLLPFLEKLPKVYSSSGDVIYSDRNELKRFTIKDCDLVVKSFRPPHIINRIVYTFFRPSKAKRSYLHAVELIKRGVETPFPVAYIEEYRGGLLYHSYYISFYSGFSRNMREFWFTPEIGNRTPVLKAFAGFTAKLHEKGVLHTDYSAGNILFEETDGTVLFTLVDVNRMHFGKVDEEEGYRNFARLWLPDETYKIIAKEYANVRGYDEKRAIERICYYKDRFMLKKK